MDIRTYNDPSSFLERTGNILEAQEAANSLMLGIASTLVADPGRYPAPPCLKTVEAEPGLALAALMTPPHKLIVYAHQEDIEAAAGTLIDDLLAEGWPLPGVIGPSPIAKRVARRWGAATGCEYQLTRQSRLFELREVIVPQPAKGRLRVAGMSDHALLARWGHAFKEDIGQPVEPEEAARQARARIEAGDIYLWEEDGRPVSTAMTTRPNRRGISVSLVYTPPELRRKGYASACVGELSRTLLASGWEYCALFADVANPTANRVYERIGYRPILDFDDYTFSP